jgi:hypothetical protein
MGDAKRRKEVLGDQFGKEERVASWLPVTKSQSEQFVKITTTGAWVGIGGMVVLWAIVRFIGPAMGWWQLAG